MDFHQSTLERSKLPEKTTNRRRESSFKRNAPATPYSMNIEHVCNVWVDDSASYLAPYLMGCYTHVLPSLKFQIASPSHHWFIRVWSIQPTRFKQTKLMLKGPWLLSITLYKLSNYYDYHVIPILLRWPVSFWEGINLFYTAPGYQLSSSSWYGSGSLSSGYSRAFRNLLSHLGNLSSPSRSRKVYDVGVWNMARYEAPWSKGVKWHEYSS